MVKPTVRVGVIWRESRSRYFLKWKDPVSRSVKTRQTDITTRNQKGERAAAKLAAQLQAELQSKLANPDSETTWEEFLRFYADQRLEQTSKDNKIKWRCAVAIFDRVWPRHVHGILYLREITPRLLIYVEEEMAKTLSPSSVLSYSATLRAGLSYAARVGLMPMLPPRPPRTEELELPAMRLAPISMESLERMEMAAHKVVGKAHAAGIAEYMRCLWLGGCRLVEPANMSAWRVDMHHPIVLTGARPMFGWASRQKNKRDQIARVTLDFAEFIRARLDRGEYLFRPTCEHGEIVGKHRLSSVIAEIGRIAAVVAEPSIGGTATAKHFRSSFVTRWARRGMPLQMISEIVRHSSIETTRKYYLAPPDPDMLRTFTESDWIGDQNGDQIIVRESDVL